MPLVETKYFGTMSYGEESAFEFPLGLPGFEEEQRFVPIELPESAPLTFLQSISRPDLCFLAFPILVVDRDYRLAVSPEDLKLLGLDENQQPRIGGEVLVLALLCLRDGFPITANLMAPVVVSLASRRAVQAIRHDAVYSHEHPVPGLREVEAC